MLTKEITLLSCACLHVPSDLCYHCGKLFPEKMCALKYQNVLALISLEMEKTMKTWSIVI